MEKVRNSLISISVCLSIILKNVLLKLINWHLFSCGELMFICLQLFQYFLSRNFDLFENEFL